MDRIGSKNIDARQDGTRLSPAYGRASYLFNSTIAGIEEADAILLVGTNPRIEASLVNVRIRKRWRMAPLPIGMIGENVNLTYPYEYLGAGPETLADLLAGRHSFGEKLKGAERPLVIVGPGALSRAGRPCGALAGGAARIGDRRGQGWLERLFHAPHRGGVRRRARSRFRPRAGRARRWRDGARRRGRSLQPWRRRDRDRAGCLRDLSGHAWRPRRASRGRHFARRRLYRKVGHLRQYRRAGPDGEPRGLPAR